MGPIVKISYRYIILRLRNLQGAKTHRLMAHCFCPLLHSLGSYFISYTISWKNELIQVIGVDCTGHPPSCIIPDPMDLHHPNGLDHWINPNGETFAKLMHSSAGMPSGPTQRSIWVDHKIETPWQSSIPGFATQENGLDHWTDCGCTECGLD